MIFNKQQGNSDFLEALLMSSSVSILVKRVEYFIWQMHKNPLAKLHVGEVELDAMEVNESYDLAFCSSKEVRALCYLYRQPGCVVGF